jgi:AcrR family transcriptional regulator
MRTNAGSSDDQTRARLLEAAGQIFAEEGYHWAKIRAICVRANANVASVNYHFGDKLGLYREVLRRSIASAVDESRLSLIQSTSDPREKLRIFVETILSAVFEHERPAWHVKLMLQEMAQPTPALDVILEQLIRPKYRLLCQIVGAILDSPSDAQLSQLCAHSVIGQVRHYLIAGDVIGRIWPEFSFDRRTFELVVNHILTFSFAGMEALRQREPHVKRRSR